MRYVVSFAIALACGMLLWLGLDDGRVATTSFRVPVSAQHDLVGRIYTPKSAQKPYPSVILCHGIRSSKDTMSSLAFELARRGIAAVTFDFGGSGQSYHRPQSQLENQRDAETILAWVRQQTSLDRQRIGIAGHSMGGTTALELAKANPQLKTTIILGIGGEATPTSPQNLLFGSGVYEELNPVSEMRIFLSQAVGKDAKEMENFGNFQGDFKRGTARSLVLSPSADHAIAPYDPVLLKAAVTWVEQSFELPPSNLSIVSHWRLTGIVLSFIGATALSIYLYRWMMSRTINRTRLLVKIAIAGSAILLFVMLLPASIGTSIGMGSLMTLCCGNYDRFETGRLESLIWKIALYAATIYLAFIVSVFAHSAMSGSLLGVPDAIAGFLRLALDFPFKFAYNLLHVSLDFLSSFYGLSLAAILVAIEGVKPGIVLDTGELFLSKAIQFIRQPLDLNGHTHSKKSFQLTIVFLVLLGVLFSILWHQQRSGFLTWDSFKFTIGLLVPFVFLPASIAISIARSSWFQNLEVQLQTKD
jgi:pimeloyl-ACP methyl ester carboxylesterase